MREIESPPTTAAWTLIDAEKRRDRLIKRMCVAAWSATLVVVMLFAVIVGATVFHMYRLAQVGAETWANVFRSAMPFVGALWTLCLLVATLSTVALFLRMRTASLSEIRLRLAALEEMIATHGA